MHFSEAKGILSARGGMNIYRGCTHGCIYCDSRSRCYQINHDFEDIEVKRNAPELLEQKLSSKRKKCMIGTGAMCDPYMHCEAELGLMRRCLEIIKRRGFGVTVHTKSDLILRDINIIEEINAKSKAVVQMTLTTADENMCRVIEPAVCTTNERVKVLAECKKHGIPTVVWLSPFLPFINDTEQNVRRLMEICIQEKVRGIICFGIGLTLREGNREYFYSKLDQHFSGLKEKYIRTYGNAYEVTSPENGRLMRLLVGECQKAGIEWRPEKVFEYLNTFPEEKQAAAQGMLEF